MGIAIFFALIPIAIMIYVFVDEGFSISRLFCGIGMSLVTVFIAGILVGIINLDTMDPEKDYKEKTEVGEYQVYVLNEIPYLHEKNADYTIIDKDGVPTKIVLTSVTHSSEVSSPIVKEVEYTTLAQWYYYIYMIPMRVNVYNLILPVE